MPFLRPMHQCPMHPCPVEVCREPARAPKRLLCQGCPVQAAQGSWAQLTHVLPASWQVSSVGKGALTCARPCRRGSTRAGPPQRRPPPSCAWRWKSRPPPCGSHCLCRPTSPPGRRPQSCIKRMSSSEPTFGSTASQASMQQALIKDACEDACGKQHIEMHAVRGT
jgi:hypothetical protein